MVLRNHFSRTGSELCLEAQSDHLFVTALGLIPCFSGLLDETILQRHTTQDGMQNVRTTSDQKTQDFAL